MARNSKIPLPSADLKEWVEEHLDTAYLVESASRLARVPTQVPLGFDTLMAPDDPKLVHYVQGVLRPELVDLGVWDLIDAPGNNLIARLGSAESGRSLLIQNYTVTQHFNLMENPFSGKVGNARKYGLDEPAIFGQGISQNKIHQAVMLAVLRMVLEGGRDLRGRLYWAVNNEGRSTHECSAAILSVLDEKPEFGILQIDSGLQITLGNRGRVDIDIHVVGKPTHSSTPDDGLSAIDGINEVLNRLKGLSWPDQHPLLGGRHAIVYKMRFEPMAPHTLPGEAFVTVDRRMLPGDDPDQAAQEICDLLADLSPFVAQVDRGVFMLPALIDPDNPGVLALQRSSRMMTGREAEGIYLQSTFDAGGLCAVGVPTVMYGAGGGDWPVGDDFVTVADAVSEAKVLSHMIFDVLG